MRIVTARQMREAEKLSVEHGMTYLQLMENAGKMCAKTINSRVNDTSKKITVVCGNGNNGGDGFVIAYYMIEYGYEVDVVLALGEAKTEISCEVFKRLTDMTCPITDYTVSPDKAKNIIRKSDIIVDCIFGVGLSRDVEGKVGELIDYINSRSCFVFSVDVPSGIDSDTGKIMEKSIIADSTLAIVSLKPCHVFSPGMNRCGETKIVSIGITEEELNSAGCLSYYTRSFKDIKSSFKKREPESNKGDYGHVLSICGSRNMPGAAVLAAKGAVRGGAGLVTVAFPDVAYNAISSKLTVPLLLPLPSNEDGYFSKSALMHIMNASEKVNVILIGCGLGVNSDTIRIVGEVIRNAKVPIIIDADGINIISQNINIIRNAKVPIVLTPHPGEMSRLTGRSIAEIQQDRIQCARKFAFENDVTLVLKGSNTVVAVSDEREVYVNTTGNAGMAKGGSGDLLAGVIASFVAQGMSCKDAAQCGVYVHGMAGDLASMEKSMISSNPLDVAECLPLVFSQIEK